MTTLFPPSEFDDWAATYDSSTASDAGFPFDGYTLVLQKILSLSNPKPDDTVLDLGIGTSNLARLYAGKGWEIWEIDFSAEMLSLAKLKLSGAQLACLDIRSEWPEAFQRRYDRIVSTYTFHHFPLEEKILLVRWLLGKYLQPDGNLVIGDIAFQDAAAEDCLRRRLGEDWEQEYYWLAEESISAFSSVRLMVEFWKLSSCAGVFRIKEE